MLEITLETFKQTAVKLSAGTNLGNTAEQIAKNPLQFLSNYVCFNQKAPYAVATITGALGNLEPFGTETHDILGWVHAAIGVDEMGREPSGFRDPHPVLARMLVTEAANFLSASAPVPTAAAKQCSQAFYDVYTGAGTDLSDPVCAATVLGAHAASEHTAIAEFAAVSKLLQTLQPALFAHLEKTNLTAFPDVPAITWLACHGGDAGVETIHAEYALKAASEIIHTPEQWQAWQSGFNKIVAVLNGFFAGAEINFQPRSTPDRLTPR